MLEPVAVKLLENSITLYLDNDEKQTRIEDALLTDEAFLKQCAELWRSNEPTLRALIRSINADLVKYMVEKATPVETVGIRHELQGAEKILHRLAKYAAEYERFEKKGRSGQNSSEGEGTQEVPTEPPEVKEGQEGSL